MSLDPVLNIAFYRFLEISNLQEMRVYFKELCAKHGLRGTMLLSPEGINAYMAGPIADVRAFQAFLEQDPRWAGLDYKESYSPIIPSRRLLVKIKTAIIPSGDPELEMSRELAPRISAQELKQWLDEKREFHLLDTRNDYEIKEGTFEGAIDLELKNFRQFPEKLRESTNQQSNSKQLNPDKPLVMFCTGGIRCEKASLMAQKAGFKEVYQLDGGILKYFEECGDAHYRGGCYVFDQRVAVDPNLQPVYSIPGPSNRGKAFKAQKSSKPL